MRVFECLSVCVFRSFTDAWFQVVAWTALDLHFFSLLIRHHNFMFIVLVTHKLLSVGVRTCVSDLMHARPFFVCVFQGWFLFA